MQRQPRSIPMTLKIEATFENGVFVALCPPPLADHERVSLTVESTASRPFSLDVIQRRRGRRIQIDPALARKIAQSAEFNPEN